MGRRLQGGDRPDPKSASLTRGRGAGGRRCGTAGYVLLEVIAATAILSLLVAPVCSALLVVSSRVDTAARERYQQEVVPRHSVEDYRWSEVEVVGVEVMGSDLFVRFRGDPDASIEVGWWLEGWFQQTQALGPEMVCRIAPPVGGWPHTVSRVVIRARRAGGAWGVAWRIAVPPATPAGEPWIESTPTEKLLGAGTVVVHARISAPRHIRVGTTDLALEGPVPPGGVAVAVTPGLVDVTCDGGRQSAAVEAGGVVHLYF